MVLGHDVLPEETTNEENLATVKSTTSVDDPLPNRPNIDDQGMTDDRNLRTSVKTANGDHVDAASSRLSKDDQATSAEENVSASAKTTDGDHVDAAPSRLNKNDQATSAKENLRTSVKTTNNDHVDATANRLSKDDQAMSDDENLVTIFNTTNNDHVNPLVSQCDQASDIQPFKACEDVVMATHQSNSRRGKRSQDQSPQLQHNVKRRSKQLHHQPQSRRRNRPSLLEKVSSMWSLWWM